MAETLSFQPPGDFRQRTSLYVGDLDPELTEMDLKAAFLSLGPVSSVRLCRCSYTGKSLCYGYVNFYSHNEACKALSILNHAYLKGKPMRLMWSQRDPSVRKSGFGNLFVKNLDPSVDGACLERTFCQFGTILSCKVVEKHGKSKGFGFVQFDSEDSALAARTALHDTMLGGKKLCVSKFVKRSERTITTPCKESNYTNLYVKNLAEDMTEDTLKNMFSAFGKVSNAVIMKYDDGKSRGFGFVNFVSAEDARKAVDALNGSLLGSRTLFVGRAQKKAERIKILQHDYMDIINSNIEKLKNTNLFVKNLDEKIHDRKLQELFSAYGKIISAKVMRHDSGVSRGFGFVSFSSPEEANKALNSLNGTMFEGKSIYVAIAQCKRDRYLELQKYFAQCQFQPFYLYNNNVVPPPISPRYFNFPYCSPPITFMHHQMSYQNFGANMGVQYPLAGQSYQQHLCSYIPMGRMDQNTQNPTAQSGQSHYVKHATYNLRDRDLNHGYAGIQNVGARKKWNKNGGVSGSTSRGLKATSCLAAAKSLSHLKKDIGNCLHPLVENLQPEYAGKITGKLLEMNNSDVINLLNSPTSLALHVDRAAQMLKEANALKTADTSAALPKSARCLDY